MTLRIGFIGCVKSSRALLEVLISMPEVDVCAVVTKQASKVNADFSDLTDICQLNSIPYHYESVDQRGLSGRIPRELSVRFNILFWLELFVG